MNGSQKEHKKTLKAYQERRDLFVNGLNGIGWDIPKPKATFYIWSPVLPGYSSMSLVSSLLEKAGVVTTPGVGFGESGEGFLRMSLTINKKRLEEAVERIAMWVRSG